MARRARRVSTEQIDPVTWAFMNDADFPPGMTRGDIFGATDDVMRTLNGLPPIAEVWQEHQETVLSAWIRESPGTRPSLWWVYSAPAWPPDEMPARWRGAFFAAELRAPRRRVGGIGTPTHDCLNYKPEYDCGIPRAWLTAEDVTTYAKHGPFPYAAVDPYDPPTFEAETVYLERHGLLTPSELEQYALGDLDVDPEAVDASDDTSPET